MYEKTSIFLTTLVLLASLKTCNCFAWENSTYRVPECRLQLCGDHIPKALHLVCGARYNRLFKRQQRNSIEYDDEKSLSSPSSFVEEYLRKLFIPKQRAVAVLKPHQKRGIVHECCLKPCCLRELYDYCRQEYITWSFG